MRVRPPGPAPTATRAQIEAAVALRAAGWSLSKTALAIFGSRSLHDRVRRAERRYRRWIWPWQASDEELDGLMEQALTRADEMAAEGADALEQLEERFG